MNKKKPTIILDIFQPVDAFNGTRSGIFSATIGIAKELLKSPDFNFIIYAKPTHYYSFIETFQSITPQDKQFKILCESRVLAAFNYCKYNKTLFNKILFILLFPIAILEKARITLFPPKYKAEGYFSTYHFPACNIANEDNIKKFLFLHDCAMAIGVYKKTPSSYFKEKIFNKLRKDFFYFTNSEYTRQDFIKHNENVNNENSQVVYLGISENFSIKKEGINNIKEKYKIPKNKKYILTLCTLEPRKNLIRMVSTFIDFVKKNEINDLVFVLAGGQWKDFENEFIKDTNKLVDYNKYIQRIGYVDDSDLPILYSNAEWFVYTSQYEGFGIPPLEAMACGCPVITSNATSLPEVVGDAGIMINYEDDNAHINAYETYYFNNEIKELNAKKGLERVKQFSYEKTANLITKKFKEICN